MTLRGLGVVCIVTVVSTSAACTGHQPLGPSPASPGSPQAAVSTGRAPVPVAGELSGTTWMDPSLPCPGPPAHFATVSSATGTVSHLGLTQMTSQHCLTGFNPDGSLALAGTTVLRAANGDEIYGTQTGNMYGYPPVPGSTLTASGMMVITGGTGRFEDASGEIAWTVEVVPAAPAPPWPLRSMLDGRIVY